MQRGTFQFMKSVNKSLILNLIRTAEPISRAQISKETSLTPPTVSSIVKELIEAGLVIESRLGESSGGRKPVMLHLNSESVFAIGVDAGPEAIECALSDLTGKFAARERLVLGKPQTSEDFIKVMKEGIRRLLAAANEKVVGIGVAMHGVVNTESGVSIVAPNLDLRNIAIKDELEREFNLDVKVENDARAMALGESWFGGHGGAVSMVAVNIGRGVGSGLVIDKKLYHGAGGLAGELGHMTVDLGGPVCECGNSGCLQTFISGEAIAASAREKLKSRGSAERMPLSGKEVYEMALLGDEACREALEHAGEIIGVGLCNLIHLVNPEKIILGGGVLKSAEFLLPAITRTIARRGLTEEARQTPVAVSQLKEDATLLGAVALLLVELFSPQNG